MVILIYHRQHHSVKQVMLQAAIQSWQDHLKSDDSMHIVVVGDKVPDALGVQNIVVSKEENTDDMLRCIQAAVGKELTNPILTDSRTILCNDLYPGHLLVPMADLHIPHIYRLDELIRSCTGSSFLEQVNSYRERCEPGMVMPTDWRKDNWLLPVVSKNPPASLIKQLIKEKLFIRFAPSSDSSQTELFIEGLFVRQRPTEDSH